MNIIKEQNGNLSMQLKLSIGELDYSDRVKKELNKLRVKAQMPGFRQGHVPFGLIQKMYGQAVLVEEINKILQESVGKFLEEEKIDLLGAPFPAPDSPSLDFEYDTEFNFTLNVILSPEINIDFLPTLPTTYYKIKATDAVIDEHITTLRQQFKTNAQVFDSIEDSDLLYCNCQSLENENVQSTTIEVVDQERSPWTAAFIGHKVNDTLEVDMDEIFEENPEEARRILKIKEEDDDVSQATGIFKFTITEVKRQKESEVNEELFVKAYPRKEIKTEKEFREAIAEEYSEAHVEIVNVWFSNTNLDTIVKAATLQYDDEMLRQFMEHQKRVHPEEREEEEEITDDTTVSDEEFEKIKRGTSWQLIQQKLIETYDIKVEADEIKQEARVQISRHFGIDPIMMDDRLGEYMDGMVDKVLKDKKQLQELYTRVLDRKMARVLKENTQITTEEVTWDEFRELVEPKKEEAVTTAPKKTRRSSGSKKEAQPSSEEEVDPKEKKPSKAKKPKEENPEQQSLFE